MLRKRAIFDFQPQKIVLPTDLTRKTASKVAKDIGLPVEMVLPGKLLVATRAISNRVNDNGDFFGSDQLYGEFDGHAAHNDKYGYRTFIGCPSYLDHNNGPMDDPRGRVFASSIFSDDWNEKIASKYPRLEYTEHEPTDTWVLAWHEIDADRYPMTALAIEKGLIKSTSMGCDVAESSCNICHNIAKFTYEYCDHIASHKMRRRFVCDDNTEKLAYERNYGIGFFEDSLLTVAPADPSADILQVVGERNPSKEALLLNRQSYESVGDWVERRSDLAKAAFKTSFNIPKAIPKNIKNNTTKISRENIMPRVIAKAENKNYKLFVQSDSPDVVFVQDKSTGRETYFGKTGSMVNNNDLANEFNDEKFNTYVRSRFSKQEALLRRTNMARKTADIDETQDRVQEQTSVPSSPEPSDANDTVKATDTVQDAVSAAGIATEPSDANDTTDKNDGAVQKALPPEGSEALDDSTMVTDPDDDVKMAMKTLANYIKKTGGDLPDFLKDKDDEDKDADKDADDDDDAKSKTASDDDKSEDKDTENNDNDDDAKPFPGAAPPFGSKEKEAKSTKLSNGSTKMSGRAEARRRALNAARKTAEDGDMENSPNVNTDDKGMAEPLPAPDDGIKIEMYEDSAAADGGDPDQAPTVEDEGVQRSMASQEVQREINRRTALLANKIWDSLELTKHRIRLGQVDDPNRLLVESRKCFDTMSHSDIRAQIKALAGLIASNPRTASHNAGNASEGMVLNRPVISKMARSRQELTDDTTAFESAFADL